jgi:hypothetical protein
LLVAGSAISALTRQMYSYFIEWQIEQSRFFVKQYNGQIMVKLKLSFTTAILIVVLTFVLRFFFCRIGHHQVIHNRKFWEP